MKATKSELAFLKQIAEELYIASCFICERDNLPWGVSKIETAISKIETAKRLIVGMTNEAEIIE